MRIIGLAGGIASGKSAVAKELAALGSVVLDADRAAHEVINLPAVRNLLVDRWGPEIQDIHGELDRQQVARRVFSTGERGRSELRFLEQTLHPRIRQQFESELARLTDKGVEVAVIDAPLLLEAGWGSLCDAILFVDSDRQIRLERALQRGWSEEEFSSREAAQMPMNEKRLRATQVIANNGSHGNLTAQVREFWEKFTNLP